jgi:RNA polymerase sigma-70 factor, ECF subfamily
MTTSNLKSIMQREQIMEEENQSAVISKDDPDDFSAVYDRYVQPVYRYLYYRTGSPAEAEDLTSQTFLSALEALPRYRHEGNFAAWLFRIARSKFIDHARRQQKQLPLTERYPAEGTDLLTQVVHTDEVARLSALIHQLDEDEQELIRLRYTAGLPFAQIAQILGSTENAVKKGLYRIVARLQSQLEGQNHA